MMTKNYTKLVSAGLTLAAFLPAVTLLTSVLNPVSSKAGPEGEAIRHTLTTELPFVILTVGGGWLALEGLRGILSKRRQILDDISAKQAIACDRFEGRKASFAIGFSAALSILLELSVIRWQGTVFELFAFYKNLSLLACFMGLGLGYAVANSRSIPLVLTAPLLIVQMISLIVTRHGLRFDRRSSLKGMPVLEQLNMGVRVSESFLDIVAVYWFLATVILLTALAFVPVGQLCGRLMNRVPTLHGYGLNLAGSLAGVLLMFILSAMYLPPAVWFATCLGGLATMQSHHRAAFGLAAASVLSAVVILCWPVSFGWELVYSPYQLLERGPSQNGYSMVRSAGTYYQRIHDLSDELTTTTTNETIREIAKYYEFPYRVFDSKSADVLVLGSGTGNDVAAALRRSSGRIDAVEIDPAIFRIGQLFHPEKPYDDPRVTTVVDDARNFLRCTQHKYDLIVYGLLDSHTLLSHASNLRLDSFVYTVEGLREARSKLKPGGMLSLSFSVLSPELGRKIFLMLQEAFDGKPPVCVQSRFNYDDAVVFLQSNDDLELPPAVLTENEFRNVTGVLANSNLKADVSTDDWPFFYMPRRVYPMSYLGMIALILGIGIWLMRSVIEERPGPADAPFFFLGAGFLLVQTKAITELGLAFGNTWQVIGFVISAMLAFAFLANVVVDRLGIRPVKTALTLVVISLAFGYWIAATASMPAGFWGRLATVTLLTCPVFFSGVAFSALASNRFDSSRILSANLFGALCGGLTEYNAMYFGFRFLYLLAIVIYLLALFSTLVPVKRSKVLT